jgi:hypothetical protein
VNIVAVIVPHSGDDHVRSHVSENVPSWMTKILVEGNTSPR